MMRRVAITLVAAVSLSWPWFAVGAPRDAERAATSVELPSKPTGPIAVEHRLTAVPTVGVPMRIAITAHVEGEGGGLNIAVNATNPDALLLTTPALVTADEGVYSWDIVVVPLAINAGYLSVIVSGTIDGQAQARSVTIPLRSATAPAASPVTVAGSETLIALPVQESP